VVIARPLAADDDGGGVEALVGADGVDLGFDLATGHRACQRAWQNGFRRGAQAL
jgi:hypothetical protein